MLLCDLLKGFAVRHFATVTEPLSFGSQIGIPSIVEQMNIEYMNMILLSYNDCVQDLLQGVTLAQGTEL